MSVIALKYYCIAIALSLFIILFNVFSSTGEITDFGQGCRYFFWLTIGTGSGMFLGAVFRKWLMPDAIYTNEGATGLLKAKLFWAIGPQCIGWLLGLLAVGQRLY